MYYIIFNDYWKFLNNDLEREIKKLEFNVEIIHLKWRLKETIVLKILRRVLKKFNKIEWILDFTEIKNKEFLDEDKIIYFDILEEEILKNVTLYQKKGKRIFWLWNKVEEKKISNLKKFFDNIWTFDEGDAQKNSLKLTNQFYWHIERKKIKEKYDFYFIGKNKGRIEKLIYLKNIMSGYNFKIEIVLNPYFDMINYIIHYKKYNKICNFKSKYYEQIMKSIQESKCIIELTKEKQSGLTLRALEALFLKKKLITDNMNIKKYDFYNENNIYILNRETDEITKEEKQNIENFLKKEYIEVSDEIKEKYTLQTWLKNLLEDK